MKKVLIRITLLYYNQGFGAGAARSQSRGRHFGSAPAPAYILAS